MNESHRKAIDEALKNEKPQSQQNTQRVNPKPVNPLDSQAPQQSDIFPATPDSETLLAYKFAQTRRPEFRKKVSMFLLLDWVDPNHLNVANDGETEEERAKRLAQEADIEINEVLGLLKTEVVDRVLLPATVNVLQDVRAIAEPPKEDSRFTHKNLLPESGI